MVHLERMEALSDPYEVLIAAIFQQAFADCKKAFYHDELIAFARSKWCHALLLGIPEERDVERMFLKEIEKYQKDDGCGVNIDPYQLIRKRRTLGLSQAAVANYVGTYPTQVSFWESGKKWPSKESVERLCKLFGCTVDELR